MPLLQSDGFFDKLTQVKLKKYFQKKIVMALHLQGSTASDEITKCLLESLFPENSMASRSNWATNYLKTCIKLNSY